MRKPLTKHSPTLILLLSLAIDFCEATTKKSTRRATALSKPSRVKTADPLQKRRREIKLKAHKRGYFSREEMNFLLRKPNLADICSPLKNRLLELTNIGQSGRRTVKQGTLSSSSGQKTPVTVHHFTYNLENHVQVLNEVNFHHLLNSRPGILPFLRCYYETKSETKEKRDKAFYVYPLMLMDAEEFLDEMRGEGQGPGASSELVKLLRDFALGVRQLHELKIIHRAICLKSFLLDGQKKGYLGFFRTAVYEDISPSEEVGEKYFQAPEVFKGTAYSSAVDIFALGVVFFALISKKRPEEFFPDWENKEQEISIPVDESLGEYKELIERMCHSKAEKRPKIGEVVDWLERIANGKRQGKGAVGGKPQPRQQQGAKERNFLGKKVI